jgi:hypothetical protein
MTEKQLRNFWKKVDVQGPDDCWPWLGCKNLKGYGNFRIGKLRYKAHRVAWELTYGPIPECLCCCHHCDNPACVNPKHLFLGTDQDNMDDMEVKGRAKLTEEQVIEIRRLYALENHLSQDKLGILFGVSDVTICRVTSKKHWKHI